MCLGLPDAFISVSIVEALGKQLTNSGEMVRGYAAIAIGYLTFNPIAKRQTLNMFVTVAFLPRDAYMHSADYAVARCLSRCLSVRLSHAGILSKRLNVSSHFFFTIGWPHYSSFSTPVWMAIFRRGPPNGASNARGMKKSRFSTNISLYLRNDAR